MVPWRSALAAGFAGGGPIGASVPGASATQPSAGSVLDGVFTAAQASRGERTFREVCAACHDTGEFSGGRFRISWVGRPVGELFETISTLMPEADPGSLSSRRVRGHRRLSVAAQRLSRRRRGSAHERAGPRTVGDSRAAGAVATRRRGERMTVTAQFRRSVVVGRRRRRGHLPGRGAGVSPGHRRVALHRGRRGAYPLLCARPGDRPTTSRTSKWRGSGGATTSGRDGSGCPVRPRSTSTARCIPWPASAAPWPRSTPRRERRCGRSASRTPPGSTGACGTDTARASPTPRSTAAASSTRSAPPSSSTPSTPGPGGPSRTGGRRCRCRGSRAPGWSTCCRT